MRVLRPILIGSLVLSVAFGALAPSAGADQVTDDAVAWLLTQQQSDGGFEVAQFPGFETPDAVMALATDAQTTSTWSPAEALAGVEAATNGGLSALDWIDDWVDGGTVPPEQLAKLVLLVATPLGLAPEAFDPAGDGSPVDLTAQLDAISPGLFNGFMFGRLAETQIGDHVHQRDLQLICEAQKADGGWSFDGLADSANASDLDTTGFASMALVAAGVPATDAVLTAAEAYVGDGQQASGAWLSFGSEDPNATTLAVWAWLALGNGLGELDEDPLAWIASQQAEDDHIISPNDGFGVNTFATSQSLQALFHGQANADWLPRPAVDAGRLCLPADTYTDVPATAWYDNGARWVDLEDIVSGTNGAMLPQDGVNRAQASMWLNLMFDDPGGPPHSFTDVPANAWYLDGVNFIGNAPNGQIATGFGTEFRPKETLNRAQAVAWLYAAAGSPDVTGLPDHGLVDVGNRWYKDAVTWAVANGIVTGFPDMTFRGQDPVKRGQFAQWMFNLAAEPGAWAPGAFLPETVLFPPPS